MNYQSPKEILSHLVILFSDFKVVWDDENPYIDNDWAFSLHSVYMTFLPYLAAQIGQIHPDQIEQVATLINGAVDAGGDSENAVGTCFLEHIGQVGLYNIFKPFLSKEAKRRLHA